MGKYSHKNKLSNCFMIILKLYLKLNTKQNVGEGLKILTPKQVLQRLPKAGSTFENLMNEIRQIIYSLYRAKEITKKVYNNIMSPIKV